MWPRVWHVACTVDHVANPGDWFEHRLGRYSVLLVRGDDGVLRGFQNVCRHRGNTICAGSGSGATELRCPYHRWAWDLAGRLREVPSRRGFGPLRNDELGLVPVRVDTWTRLVFVNLDLDAEPLDDWLEGVPDDIAWANLDEFRCDYSTVTPVNSNWKVVNDGFSETYHVQGLHREMLASIDDVNAPQRIWNRHSASYQRYGVPSPRLGRNVDDQAVWDSFVITQGGRMGPQYREPCDLPDVPAGQTLQDVIAQKIRDHQATLGVDLSAYDTHQITSLSQYNLFPNATVLVSADLFTVMTARPGPTPDEGELAVINLRRMPSADAPAPPPVHVTVPMDKSDFGFVLNQDLSVIRTMQNGLHQPGCTHVLLSGEECRIVNMNRHLEQYLGLEPGGWKPGS
ncbi:MAG: aromatic ring-hydroxylating dioxygenase subunit alpha [Acidimicrobiaceae bacterium]|nr:aromatic ring-hydroxylating dioxygenase subunit alpha [Acidimicrobiaceae bacterium]MYH77268.1 aromatic ring-hydroxylating dioxygenase subunit alpha [Acidimicrobiaceae bacterium]MYK76539.1 aromatic ring-hydroxylating dioxygenase subunit alpha [Acidimicrobiaceae bacterium]